MRIDIAGWLTAPIAFGIAAVAIYTAAFGVIDEIYQRSITVGASVIMVTLSVPLAHIFTGPAARPSGRSASPSTGR